MEVILMEPVTNLGSVGNVVDVADGYARNYLLPKNKALIKNKVNLKKVEERKRTLELKAIKEENHAKELAKSIEGMVIEFYKKASEEGKLYGSVTPTEIVEQLEKQNVKDVNRKDILISEPIKFIGEYEVKIRLYTEIEPVIKVVINKDEE